VWICPSPKGHVQATGRDAKGRKQIIYHPDWAAHRGETKFRRLKEFGGALPKIREQVEADLRRHGLPREKVLAAIVRLLETTLIRIGNRKYVLQNGSYGLTTLRTEDAEVTETKLRFKFRGKSGKDHDISLTDRRLARVVRKSQELPGETLFQYSSENGEPCEVKSEDVNEYLREITGADFTAKDFRTWMATIEAISLYRDIAPKSKAEINQVIKTVAMRLGNTPAVCRTSYIHPAVLESSPDAEWLKIQVPKEGKNGLSPIELFALKHVI
jgi:DNA topoisomerase-1